MCWNTVSFMVLRFLHAWPSIVQKKKRMNEWKRNRNLYLPSAVFITKNPVRPSNQMKQIIQIVHIIVKNPNWLRTNHLVLYKRGRGFELGATVKQIQVEPGVGLELGTNWLRARRADYLATLYREEETRLSPSQFSWPCATILLCRMMKFKIKHD